jgi:uncharacterized membrane protein
MRIMGRIVLGLFLLLAGIGHLSWSRTEFFAQVPKWLPLNANLVVILSGIVEITLGVALITLPKLKIKLGWIVAAFFVLVFPGNIAQYTNHTPAFGLDTDHARAIRLLFQPVLVIWALWCTDAWRAWRKNR